MSLVRTHWQLILAIFAAGGLYAEVRQTRADLAGIKADLRTYVTANEREHKTLLVTATDTAATLRQHINHERTP